MSHEHHQHHEHESSFNGDRSTVLLNYMLDHNAHHMQELLECAQSLRESGRAAAAALVQESADTLNESNKKLACAIAELTKGGE